jgi:prepilin-type N-terminal cleavage/methylation domain-containing protein
MYYVKAKKTGFTLVELLVVIAIIATLVSILMPSLNKSRYQTKITMCMANQRQVIMRLQQYLNF